MTSFPLHSTGDLLWLTLPAKFWKMCIWRTFAWWCFVEAKILVKKMLTVTMTAGGLPTVLFWVKVSGLSWTSGHWLMSCLSFSLLHLLLASCDHKDKDNHLALVKDKHNHKALINILFCKDWSMLSWKNDEFRNQVCLERLFQSKWGFVSLPIRSWILVDSGVEGGAGCGWEREWWWWHVGRGWVQKLVVDEQWCGFVSEKAECGKMSALTLRQSVTNKESLRPTMVHHQTIVL